MFNMTFPVYRVAIVFWIVAISSSIVFCEDEFDLEQQIADERKFYDLCFRIALVGCRPIWDSHSARDESKDCSAIWSQPCRH